MFFFLFWDTTTEKKEIGLITHNCSECHKKASFLFFKMVETTKLFWIIPIWKNEKYYITCGSCHLDFELEEENGEKLEEQAKEFFASKENK